MKQLPDDLFRKRFKDHQQTPPQSAWSRIETNLPGSRRTTWLKVAAAVLLLLTASALMWSLRDKKNEQAIAREQSVPDKQTDRVDGSAAANENRALATEDTFAPKETPRIVPVNPPSDTRDTVGKAVPSPDHPDDNLAEIPAPGSQDAAPTEPVPLEDATAVAESVESNEPVPFKLVLEADEVSAKYLRKKSVARATEDDTKSSGLKKLLDKANDISNQDPIGDLRQMKNDIFALNFQGKKRDQHK